MITAHQYTEQVTTAETEPVTTGPNDARSPMPHHLHRHSLTQAHFFQAPNMLRAPHQLVNLRRLTKPEAIQGDNFVNVCSIYHGRGFY